MKALTTAPIFALAALTVLASFAATAADEPVRTTQDVEVVFRSLDRNDDQRISKAEAARQKSLSHRFAAVDSSGDGYLSKAEFRARPSDEPFE